MRLLPLALLLLGAVQAAPSSSTSSSSSSSSSTAGGTSTDPVMVGDTAWHTSTTVALAYHSEPYSRTLMHTIQRDQANIARAIAKFEPVNLWLPAPHGGDTYESAANTTAIFPAPDNVTVTPVYYDDMWVRDTGALSVYAWAAASSHHWISAVYANRNGKRRACVRSFETWGACQEDGVYTWDGDVYVHFCSPGDVSSSPLLLPPSTLQVDGEGTALLTESSILPGNPDWDKAAVEKELARVAGITKVIWLPGSDQDWRNGTTDMYARFVSPGHVVAELEPNATEFRHQVTQQHLDILRSATDASGRKLQVTTLTASSAALRRAPPTIKKRKRDTPFYGGYVNYHIVAGGVIAAQFGDAAADAAAKATLQDLYPGRKVVQVDIDGIAAAGAGVFAVTRPGFWSLYSQATSTQNPAAGLDERGRAIMTSSTASTTGTASRRGALVAVGLGAAVAAAWAL